MRLMKDLNDYTINAYTNFAIFLVFLPFVYIFDNGLQVMFLFDKWDWFIIIFSGMVSVAINLCRKKAVNYEEPGKLNGINFFQSVI